MKNPLPNPLQPVFEPEVAQRNRLAAVWRLLFRLSVAISLGFLALLLFNILNQSFGYAALTTKIDPASLAVNGAALQTLGKEDLLKILQAKISKGRLRQLDRELPLSERSREDVYALVWQEVVQPEVAYTWPLLDSLWRPAAVRAEAAARYPQAQLTFRSWANASFIRSSQSSDPLNAGVRTAILGSLWTIAITIVIAFPLGVGAAIYLEEYAADNWLNRLIQTNINNLAGVPSIIYGMLGLAIFVRTLQPLTSGAAFGVSDPTTANGRTILSAGLTLALLVLPLIIINAQEAIRAVPDSLRQASYGLGATQWQTIWHHVLPGAIPGILTGAILAISRAIGETAPLVVVGGGHVHYL